MRILVFNEKERLLVESMCDVALRAGGIKNMREVVAILEAIEDAEDCKNNTEPERG